MNDTDTALRNRFYDVARDFLDLSDQGSDPTIADVLGIKTAQSEGMRDAAGELFERGLERGLSLGDAAFYVHCVLTAMKYEDRAGRKGDAREDNEKAMWYRRMANHLLGFGPDPRAARPGFQPYTRPA